MTTKLVRCTCAHKFQDEMYGAGNRMANELRNGQYCCTVCGSIVGSSQSIHQAPKSKEPEPEVVKEKVKEKVVREKAKEKVPDNKAGEKDKKKGKSSMKGGKR